MPAPRAEKAGGRPAGPPSQPSPRSPPHRRPRPAGRVRSPHGGRTASSPWASRFSRHTRRWRRGRWAAAPSPAAGSARFGSRRPAWPWSRVQTPPPARAGEFFRPPPPAMRPHRIGQAARSLPLVARRPEYGAAQAARCREARATPAASRASPLRAGSRASRGPPSHTANPRVTGSSPRRPAGPASGRRRSEHPSVRRSTRRSRPAAGAGRRRPPRLRSATPRRSSGRDRNTARPRSWRAGARSTGEIPTGRCRRASRRAGRRAPSAAPSCKRSRRCRHGGCRRE